MSAAERPYLAIDIGGSKTLLATFSSAGQLLHQFKFPTPKDYKKFLKKLSEHISSEFANKDFKLACCAVPGKVDRQRGLGKFFGNLPWTNVPLKADLQELTGTGVLLENDANLAGLGEALLVHKKYKRVIYLTIGTGIGDGIIIDGKIDTTLADSEAGHMLLEHEGRIAEWEDFASGSALKRKYGRTASEIDDTKIWNDYAKALARGLRELLAVVETDVVIIGGGVGKHFAKFSAPLQRELTARPNPMVTIPAIIKAQRPEEAVIYGCYDYIRQHG